MNDNIKRTKKKIEHRAQQPAPSVPVGVDDLAASLLDARERMISALEPKFGEAFDGDFDVMRDAAKALAQQPAAVEGAYPTPRNRAEAVALARLALAHLGVIDAHIDAAIARCETDLAAQPQGDKR